MIGQSAHSQPRQSRYVSLSGDVEYAATDEMARGKKPHGKAIATPRRPSTNAGGMFVPVCDLTKRDRGEGVARLAGLLCLLGGRGTTAGPRVAACEKSIKYVPLPQSTK